MRFSRNQLFPYEELINFVKLSIGMKLDIFLLKVVAGDRAGISDYGLGMALICAPPPSHCVDHVDVTKAIEPTPTTHPYYSLVFV